MAKSEPISNLQNLVESVKAASPSGECALMMTQDQLDYFKQITDESVIASYEKMIYIIPNNFTSDMTTNTIYILPKSRSEIRFCYEGRNEQ